MLRKLRVVDTDHRDQHLLISQLFHKGKQVLDSIQENQAVNPQACKRSTKPSPPSTQAVVRTDADRERDELIAKAKEHALRRSKINKPLCWLAKSNPGKSSNTRVFSVKILAVNYTDVCKFSL